MKTKRNNIIILFLALIVTVGLVSTVTAVPYTESDGVRKMMTGQEKLHKIVTSRAFLRYQALVEPLANKTFNTTKKEMIQTAITESIIPSLRLNTTKNDPFYPELVMFLQAIIDGTCLILGHNIVGLGTAYAIVLITLSLFCCIEAICLYPIMSVMFFSEFITQPYLGDILYAFGLFGVLIVMLFAIPIAVCALLLGGAVLSALAGMETFIDTLSYLVF